MSEEYNKYQALNSDYKRIRELPGTSVVIKTVAGDFSVTNEMMVKCIIDLLIKETGKRMKEELRE